MSDPSSPTAESPDEDTERDWKLMDRIKQGDEVAFRELVEIHQGRIIGTCTRMLGDQTEAEDVAQQVFVRVWKSAHRWEPSAKFTTWLYTITRNLVFNESRRRARHPARSLDAALDDADHPQQFADPGTKTPSKTLLDLELQEAVEKAIQGLDEVPRMAIVMRRYQDVSYEEIAAVLKITVPALKSILFRARTELREKLREYMEE